MVKIGYFYFLVKPVKVDIPTYNRHSVQTWYILGLTNGLFGFIYLLLKAKIKNIQFKSTYFKFYRNIIIYKNLGDSSNVNKSYVSIWSY